ncbi:hypothetical protein [Halococcoides cellulosivorans]|uniref:Permease n=1 Tax=Halococcoides cellulosivorans TaxID=1679096 RepID=A0A2R4X1J9_9EURY|nr:hypothetical protein [Halococcoides cellulosivorans]AWB27666.1 hypothetical protein HARCEL1_08060 [Halococcoides cellulosivorans]
MLESAIDIVFGTSLTHRVVVLTAIAVYAVWFVRDAPTAWANLRDGAWTFGRLFTLIVAAMALASAIGALVPVAAVERTLGATAGPSGGVLAGVLGGLLPGGPYAVYPVIDSVGAAGGGVAAVLALAVGYGAIGVGRIPYGLVFFESRIVAARVLAGLAIAITAGAGVYLL